MNVEQLTSCQLFKGVTGEQLIDVFSKINYKVHSYKKGDIVAHQDEVCNNLIVLTEGSAQGEMIDISGKVAKIEDINAPSPLAILFLFGKKNRYPVQVTATTNIEVLVIPRQSVLAMLQLNINILTNYLDISAHYADVLSSKLYSMTFRTIRQKVIVYLLNLAKPDKTEVELDRSQNKLAEYFGVSRPSLARELTKMQDDGLITFERKKVSLINKKEMRQTIS